MGPLWAWVILWLVSAYGLVLLLRRASIQVAEEPVPVLVATPKPAEPEAPDESPDAPAEAALSEEGELTASIPARESEAIASPRELSDEPLAPAIQAIETELELTADAGSEELDTDMPAPVALSEEQASRSSAPLDGPDEAGGVESEPWIREREETEASEPWVREREATEASEPWIKEHEERTADAPWIKEREVAEASEPWRPEDEQASSVIIAAGAEDEEDDEVVFRSIDLENLTLGLEATEIQALYGSPGHMSKVGEEGEQWRYPLNATDELGAGVEGVLVLEFQRGRLVRKSLEEGQEQV